MSAFLARTVGREPRSSLKSQRCAFKSALTSAAIAWFQEIQTLAIPGPCAGSGQPIDQTPRLRARRRRLNPTPVSQFGDDIGDTKRIRDQSQRWIDGADGGEKKLASVT
jgi:hypothetical protein